MKLKDVPIGSTVKINGNVAEILSHGAMGTRVNLIESKDESIGLGKQILSNESEISLLRERKLSN